VEKAILKWPIGARLLSDKGIINAKKARRKTKQWESTNCLIARARYLLEDWEIAEHLGVSADYVKDRFRFKEWHHKNFGPWEQDVGKVFFYNPDSILKVLAKDEVLRFEIRLLAKRKHPDILTDGSILTGWEKRLYSKGGHRKFGTIGKFTIWQDEENIERLRRKDKELVERLSKKYK